MIDQHHQFQTPFFNINNWCIVMKFHRCIIKIWPRIPCNQLDFICIFQFFSRSISPAWWTIHTNYWTFPWSQPWTIPPHSQSPIPCRFGLQLNQQGLCTNFIGNQQCAAGFVCLFGPADEPGPCCLSEYLFCCYFKSFSVFWNYVFSMNMFCCGVLVWSWLFLTVLFCYVDVI